MVETKGRSEGPVIIKSFKEDVDRQETIPVPATLKERIAVVAGIIKKNPGVIIEGGQVCLGQFTI